MTAPFGIPTINRRGSRPSKQEGTFPFSPLAVGIVLVVLIVFVGLFATLSNGGADPKETTSLVGLDIILWGCLVFLVLVNGMAYIFNIDVTASIRDLFTSEPTIDVEVSAQPTAKGQKLPTIGDSEQVFHVSDNKYTYKDAKAICSAYGGRLATIKELQSAYKKGADWCGYGWSDKQMALYPTQYEKWEHLQSVAGHEHDCGRPGINGGYIANPNVRFGVNCFGRKPDPTAVDIKMMEYARDYPMTAREMRFDRRVDRWRHKLAGLSLSPFNPSSWFS